MGLIRAAADRLGVYRALRYSPLYDWYARLCRPRQAAVLANDRRFYGEFFRRHSVAAAFDIGANVGDKARVFAELAGRVVCAEPDPDLVDVLRYRFRGRPGVAIEPAAIGDAAGTAVLHRKRFAGFNTLSAKWAGHTAARAVPDRDDVTIPVTTLDALIATYGRPDYVKIDVEGYELAALTGLSSPVRAVSFECNLPAFQEETVQILDRLRRLYPGGRFNVRTADRPQFELPADVSVDEMLRLVAAAGEVTYDLFAVYPDVPPASGPRP